MNFIFYSKILLFVRIGGEKLKNFDCYSKLEERNESVEEELLAKKTIEFNPENRFVTEF